MFFNWFLKVKEEINSFSIKTEIEIVSMVAAFEMRQKDTFFFHKTSNSSIKFDELNI